jgi:hypothetical protein
MVGMAVRKGARGRGGWRYQTIAVGLTYLAIASTYVPFAVKAARQKVAVVADSARTAATHERAAATATRGDSARVQSADVPVVRRTTARHLSVGSALLAAVAVVLLVAALPIVVGMSSILSLFIFGIALFEAWKLNKRRDRVVISGPFRLGGTSSPGTVSG